MKFGVLTFGYDGFTAFKDNLDKFGFYDVNLGDNSQSIAIRKLYKTIGIDDSQIIDINRDELHNYSGGETILVMNGVFFKESFPIPDSIIPIFIGFHATRKIISEQRDFLLKHQPIGCRDEGTTAHMREFGIDAFTSGCLTLTLPRRIVEPSAPKLLIVYGSGAGYLPPEVLCRVPDRLLADAEFIYHRLPAMRFPFNADLRREAERYENALMARYCREATLVLTSLHHVATPCMAFGIPVVICRARNDIRFSLIEKLVPIHVPGSFDSIEWDPSPVNVDGIRDELIRLVRDRIYMALGGARTTWSPSFAVSVDKR